MSTSTTRFCAGVNRWLALTTVLLILLTCAVWVYDHWGRPTGTTLTFPIGPERVLRLNIWKPGLTYARYDLDHHDRLIPGQGPVMIAIWFQDNTANITTRRLALLKMPVWLLTVCALSEALILAGVWLVRVRS
jgi:hypothetical protein